MYIFTLFWRTHRKYRNKENTYYIILLTHSLWGEWRSEGAYLAGIAYLFHEGYYNEYYFKAAVPLK